MQRRFNVELFPNYSSIAVIILMIIMAFIPRTEFEKIRHGN